MDPRKRLQVLQQSSPSIRVAAAPKVALTSLDVAHQGGIQVGNQTINQDPNAVAGVAAKPRPLSISAPVGIARGISQSFHDATDILPQAVGQLKALTPKPLDPIADKVRAAAQTLSDIGSGSNVVNAVIDKNGGGIDKNGNLLDTQAQKIATPTRVGLNVAGAVLGAGELAQTAITKGPTLFKNATSTLSALRTGGAAAAKEQASINRSVGVAGKLGVDANLLHSLKSDNDVSSVLGKLIDAGHTATPELIDTAKAIAASKNAREIGKALIDLPMEAGAAAGGAAFVSDALAKEKYGNSPLTGEQAPAPIDLTPPEQVIPLDMGGGAPGLENAPQQGIPLTNTALDTPLSDARIEEALRTAGVQPSDIHDVVNEHFTTPEQPAPNFMERLQAKREANTPATPPPPAALTATTKSFDELPRTVGDDFVMADNGTKNIKSITTEITKVNNQLADIAEGKISASRDDIKALQQRHDDLVSEAQKPFDYAAVDGKPSAAPSVEAIAKSSANEGAVAPEVAQDGSTVKTEAPTPDQTVSETVNKNADRPAAAVSKELDSKTIRYTDAETGKTKTASVAELRQDIQDFKEKYGTEDLTGKQQRKLDELERNYHVATFDAEASMPGATAEEKAAVQKIVDGLGDNLKNYDSAKKLRAKERAIRFAKGTGANESVGGGMDGYKAKLGSMKGKLATPKFNAVSADPKARDSILDLIESNGKARGWQDGKRLNTQTAILKVLGEVDGAPTPSDVRNIREFFGDDVADAVQEAVDKHPKDWQAIVSGIAGLPKSLMSTFDFSAPRQAGQLAASHPVLFVKRYAQSIKAAFNTEYYDSQIKKLVDSPYSEIMDNDMGLDRPGVNITSEEKYNNANIAEKIPGYGKTVVKASERAYNFLLAGLRNDVATRVIDNAGGEEGYRAAMAANYGDKAKEASRVWGETINTLSGRGGTKGGLLEKHMSTAGATLFSPRLWASKIQQLNPVWYAKLAKENPAAAKEAIKAQAAFYSMVGTTLYLASRVPGVDIGTDMRSADFGKIKIGNTRIDIMGGQQQNIVQAWRQISGEKVNSETGVVTKLGQGYGTTNRFDLLVDMLISKSNPLINTAIGVAKSHDDPNSKNPLKLTDQYGDSYNVAAKVGSLGVPLNIQGIAETTKDTGSIGKGLALNSVGFAGAGVNTYGKTATKDKAKADNNSGVPKDAAMAPKGQGLTDVSGKAIFYKDKNGKYVQATKPATKDSKLADKLSNDKAVRQNLGKAYDSKLGADDAALVKTSADDLKSYLDKGDISQQQYDHAIKLHTAKSDYIKTKSGLPDPLPDGIKPGTPEAKFYNKYNTLVSKDQAEFIKHGNSDPAAKAVVDSLNADPGKPSSVPVLGKANNQLAKQYADYKADLEKNKDNYTDVDLQNKAKAFWTGAIKTQYDSVAQDLYSEGNSKDYKALVAEGKITKPQLDQAIKLDNALYQTGFVGLKFGKKFRDAAGYAIPSKTADGKTTLAASGGGSGGGSGSKSTNAHLTELLPSASMGDSSGSAIPKFSAKSRSLKLKSNISLPQGSSKKVTIRL